MSEMAPPGQPATELITCPECGSTAMVTLNRRESGDFCRNCDYPLFWTPSEVLRDPAAGGEESLRRLPGTVGRTTVASLTCPHCAELNVVSAVNCIRCGLPMHPVAEPPPAPEPVYVPAPEPVVVPAKGGVPWWEWALLALAVAIIVTLIVLAEYHVIG